MREIPFFGKITAKAIDRILLVPIIFLRPGLYNIAKAFREPTDYTFDDQKIRGFLVATESETDFLAVPNSP